VFYAHAVSRNHAPVVLFAYRRPDHLRRALDSLAANPGADRTALSIYCDGAKSEIDREAVERVREIALGMQGSSEFDSVRVIERDHNIGLAASVISGVTQILEDHESVIVMEDDLVVSPDFLEYMNQALELYVNNEEVISIHGFMYSVPPVLPQTVFLRGADCWGWATWRRGWEIFEPDSAKLLRGLDKSPDRAEFDFNGAFPYRQMLKDQADGTIDSWAIRWYASAFLANKLTLYPGQSLVENIGQEGSGTHSESATSHEVMAKGIDLPIREIDVSESAVARQVISQSLKSARVQPNKVTNRLTSAISQLLGRAYQ
jgi:hypothetical protein